MIIYEPKRKDKPPECASKEVREVYLKYQKELENMEKTNVYKQNK